MKRRTICSATAMVRSGWCTSGGFVRWASAIVQLRRAFWQNGHVERLIGSVRRECLDHLVVFGEAHLRRILKSYASYHNEIRIHLALDKGAPNCRRSQTVGAIVPISVLGGLHHQYVRV